MLYHVLQSVVEQHPNNLALADEKCHVNYLQMWNSSVRIASQLRSEGLAPGNRVCLLSENSITAVCLQWAIWQCEAIAVYLNEQTPSEGLQQIIDDAEPLLIVATQKLIQAKLSTVVTDNTGFRLLDMHTLCSADNEHSGEFIQASDELAEVRSENPDSIATIVYTSGSTGKPKGVCLTHTNLVSVAKMAGDGYNTVPADSYLMVVPLHYIHGLMVLMALQQRGAGIHFMNSFTFPKLVVQRLLDTKVTGFSGVPFHITALIERGGFLTTRFPHLRWIGVTGGSCATERLHQIRANQPDLEIHISYGQTECSPRITALHPDKIDTKSDSVGCVAEGLYVEFLDDSGKAVASGETGELVVTGPTVMHGYWNDPIATAQVIDDKGRLHTGDLAYIDEEGDVFIKGRLQAMIKTAGERIFPEELEAVLNLHSLVIDAAVVGVEDVIYGQQVEAHLILSNDSDESLESVKKHCLEHVAFARSPKRYHLWKAFPLKANGKTDKQKLIDSVGQKSQGDTH